jgi:hypothetical protein
MKSLLVILIFLTSFSTLSAVPSVEGLFRNPNSQDIDGDLIVIKAIVQRESTEEQVFTPRYLKFIFSLESESRIQFLQAEYSDGKMDRKSLIKTLFLKDLMPKILNDELLERNLFYSYLIMYGLNNSDGISNILKKYSTNFIANKDALNKEKIELYDRYKKYLMAIKNDETIKDELVSPMDSEDEEEKKKIQELKSSNMYSNDESLSLEKEGRQFVLKLKLDGVSAKFTNEEHRLINFKVTKGTSDVETFFADYILFNGRHELPKNILLKDQENNNYKIRFVGFSIFTNKGDSLTKRALKYKENELENQKNITKVAPKEPVEGEEVVENLDVRPIIIY